MRHYRHTRRESDIGRTSQRSSTKSSDSNRGSATRHGGSAGYHSSRGHYYRGGRDHHYRDGKKYHNRLRRNYRYRNYDYGHYGYGYHQGYYNRDYYYPDSFVSWVYSPYRYCGPFGFYFPYRPVYRSSNYRTDAYRGQGMGALDLDVSPAKTQVFVDGEYVGIVDQYDGFPAYLWLEEGTYDIAFYHEGYETLIRQYSVGPARTIDVNDDLRPGVAKHPDELMTPKSTERRDERIRRNRERERDAERERSRAERSYSSDQVSRLMLDVYPDDAAIYLDGHFLGTGKELAQLSAGLIIEPGPHTLEVVRPGYETRRKQFTVPPGERLHIDLDLDEGGTDI